MYYKSGDGFLLVYDIGAPSSLDDVRERYGEILSSLVSIFYQLMDNFNIFLHS